jgi:hypothetical protein
MTCFEIKEKRKFEFELKLNQVHLPLIHCNHMVKNCRLQYSGYSDTRGVTSGNTTSTGAFKHFFSYDMWMIS